MATKDITTIFNKLQHLHKGAGCELNYSSPFELLVAVILSAQCTDIRVNKITEKLFEVYNTPEQFASLELSQLKPYIFSCGFYNNKGNSIIEMSKTLVHKHNSQVPSTMEELVELAGVGRKTASVVLSVAFGIPAMPVDTHVFRVSRRIGIARANDVLGVERELSALIDKDKWNDMHHYLIFHGRYICRARNPNCQECTLKTECDYYNNILNRSK